MKKFLTLFIAMILVFSAGAQVRVGVKGGVMFNDMSDLKIGENSYSFDHRTGFQAGIVVQAKIPGVGLAIQPELLYTSKGARLVESNIPPIKAFRTTDAPVNGLNFRTDYIELPVNIQWGIDLLLVKPFLQVSPYVSYAIGKYGSLVDTDWKNLNRWDYGMGIGAGIDIWIFQIAFKYSWSFG